MAPRKKRTLILERDSAFAKTIGSSSNNKPDPMSVALAQANSRIEAEHPERKVERADRPSVVSPIPAKPMVEAAKPAAVKETETEAIPSEAEHPDPAKATSDPSTTQAGREGETVQDVSQKAGEEKAGLPGQPAQSEAARAGEPDAHVEVRVSMLVHSDLAKRAETWGKSIGLSGATVLRQSFAKLKPELIAEMKEVKAGDVHMERAESVGPRIQSLLRFNAADYAAMQARLDPAGFGILSSMLNHYARARFSDHLDNLLLDAGY